VGEALLCGRETTGVPSEFLGQLAGCLITFVGVVWDISSQTTCRYVVCNVSTMNIHPVGKCF
jgi:hypothetical protein